MVANVVLVVKRANGLAAALLGCVFAPEHSSHYSKSQESNLITKVFSLA